MQKLIDANNYKESLKALPDTASKKDAIELLGMMPTINPENLPIVRQLRAELARVTAERDAAVRDMHQNTKCFICARLPEDGNMAHCKHYAGCGLNYMHWVWRGPHKEDNSNG